MKKVPVLSQKDILNSLRTIIDPELGINIVDLGLVYRVTVTSKSIVKVLMTLTSIGCPLSYTFREQVSQVVKQLPRVKEVEVELTFDPPWSAEKMSDSAKQELGI